MNIIERYISAYVVHCLFPTATENKEHLNYVFEVLRETGSTPKNDILRNVLNYVRQGDPADPKVQHEVALYVKSFLDVEVYQRPKSEFIGRYHKTKEATMVVVLYQGQPVAFAGCAPDKFDECKQQLEEAFPGIQLVEE